MIESTGKSLLKSLVDAKQQLHVAAKDFDSEDAFRQGQENLAHNKCHGLISIIVNDRKLACF